VRDRLYLPGRKNPLFLPADSPALLLLMHLRDEAHRLAIGFHRKKARQAALDSILHHIPGLGPKRRRRLLRHFPDFEALKQASVTELCQAAQLPNAVAERLLAVLQEAPSTPSAAPTPIPEAGGSRAGEGL